MKVFRIEDGVLYRKRDYFFSIQKYGQCKEYSEGDLIIQEWPRFPSLSEYTLAKKVIGGDWVVRIGTDDADEGTVILVDADDQGGAEKALEWLKEHQKEYYDIGFTSADPEFPMEWSIPCSICGEDSSARGVMKRNPWDPLYIEDIEQNDALPVTAWEGSLPIGSKEGYICPECQKLPTIGLDAVGGADDEGQPLIRFESLWWWRAQ